MSAVSAVNDNTIFFQRALEMIDEWKETILIASKILGIKEENLRKALESLDLWEEEVLRLSLIY